MVMIAVSLRSFVWSNMAVKVTETEFNPGGIVIWPAGPKLSPNM